MRVRGLRGRAPAARRQSARAVLLGAAVAAVLTLVGAGLARLEIDTGTDSFAPADSPAAQALHEVSSSFGGDPVVVLLESEQPGALLSGPALPQLLRLEGQLAGLPDVAAVYGPATVLNQIAGQAQTLLLELTGHRDGLRARAEDAARNAGASPAEVREAGARATAEFDARYGPLLAQGLPGGLPTLRNDRFVRSVVYTPAGEPRPQWRFVVPDVDAVALLVRPRQDLDQAAAEALVERVRAAVDEAGLATRRTTVSGMPAIVAALGGVVRSEVPLLGGIALLGVGAWFLAVRWTGLRRRLVPLATTVAATGLTLALFGWLDRPLSLGTVAFLPVLLGVGSDFMTYLHRRVDRRVVVSVAVATAVSFGALAVVPVPVVRELGITLAVGIVLALAMALVATRWLPPGPDVAAPPDTRRAAGPPGVRPARLRTRVAAGVAAAILATAGWALLPRLPLEADVQGFADGLPALSDAEHVQQVMGFSGEIAVAASGADVLTQASLDWMQRAQAAIVAQHGDELRPVLSPPTLMGFLGESPTPDQLEAAVRLLPRYLTSSVIRGDQRLAVLSFGVRLDDAAELRALRDSVLRILPPPPDGVDVALTGLPMVAVAGFEQVSGDRYLVNLLGIAAAGTVLAFGLRRRGDALRAVAAAGLATGAGLLGLWLAGIALTPVTVALGSLTAAVGCEFTVVLAEAARRGDRGMRRAVLVAVAASATGYAVLAFSELSVVQGFGALLAASVGLAVLAAALVVWLTPGPAPGRAETAPPMSVKTDDLAGAI